MFKTPKFIRKISDRYFVRKQLPLLDSIEGFLSNVEARALCEYASILPQNSYILEIGCFKGKSTYCLGQGLKAGKIMIIDPFDGSGDAASVDVYKVGAGKTSLFDEFLEAMHKAGLVEKLEIFKGLSDQFVGKFSKVDLLFIDGDHSVEWCRHDFEKYSGLLKKDGLLLFHDYYEARKDLGPTYVVENLVKPPGEYEFMGLHGSLWVCRKK
jgi:predicted O-methyltransferase YrrM